MRKKILLSISITFVTFFASAQLLQPTDVIDFTDQTADDYYTLSVAPASNIFKDVINKANASVTYSPQDEDALNYATTKIIIDPDNSNNLVLQTILAVPGGDGGRNHDLICPGFGSLTEGVEYKFNFKIKGNTGKVKVELEIYNNVGTPKWSKIPTADVALSGASGTVDIEDDYKLTNISTTENAQAIFTFPTSGNGTPNTRVRLSLNHFSAAGTSSFYTIDDIALTTTATAKTNKISNPGLLLKANFIENSLDLESNIPLSKVNLISMAGTSISLKETAELNYDTSSVNSGMYILKIFLADGSSKSFKVVKR